MRRQLTMGLAARGSIGAILERHVPSGEDEHCRRRKIR